MPYRVAWDNDPTNPNPHAWDVDAACWPEEADASAFAEKEVEELREEYGDEYVNDNVSFLVIHDKYVEVNLPGFHRKETA